MNKKSIVVFTGAGISAEKYIVTLDLNTEPHRDFIWLNEKASSGVALQ